MNAPTPLSPEQEFELRLNALGRDARAAARFTYIGEAVRYSAAPKPEIIARLDRHAGFWNTVLGALQTSAILALGRIYDQRKDVLSARKLLDHVTNYRGLFSTASLSARAAMRMDAAQVAGYVAGYQPPSQAQFEALTIALTEAMALYEAKVEPIRHKVFAHAGRITQGDLHEMFGNVPVSDFERLSIFPQCLHETLWQTFTNGRELVLIESQTAVAEFVANPLGRRSIGLEPEYAVRDATDFLAWLESAPLAPESR
jgi:hypothetical protein